MSKIKNKARTKNPLIVAVPEQLEHRAAMAVSAMLKPRTCKSIANDGETVYR